MKWLRTKTQDPDWLGLNPEYKLGFNSCVAFSDLICASLSSSEEEYNK